MLTLPYDITCGYCHYSKFGTTNISPKRTVTKFEIEFYVEDGLETFADDNAYTIRKEYIQIATPGQIRYSRLPLKTMYLKFCADGELARRLSTAPAYFRSNHPEKMKALLDRIILLNESRENDLLLHSQLLALLDLVLHDSTALHFQNNHHYETVNQAKAYIEQHYAESIRLEDIAATVSLSPIYFHNIFTSACGCTPHEFLIQKRIAEAKKLLWNPSCTLSEIAESCGFGCEQYFSKIFKKIVGLPPGKYRKEFQEQYLEDCYD